MAIFKSGNPALNEKTFQQQTLVLNQDGAMTEKGTLNKFFLLFLLVMGTASVTWSAFGQGRDVTSWLWIGLIGGLITAIVLVFKPMWASFLAPVYALFEGAFVGGISAMYNFAFKGAATGATGGIVMQAVGLTFAVVIAMFALYRFGVIKATDRLKSVIITATFGIAIFYLLAMGLRFFGIDMPLIHSSGTLGIVFSLVVVGIAALNLILDFDMIENGVSMGAPKYMEWYGAFGLLVTIVWLYLEILRLLAKLNSRN